MDATLSNAVAEAKVAHPLWALLPVKARARYIRRAAVALIDELDVLATRLADETGWPRSQLLLTELLPAARGLRALADDGPAALADRRLAPVTALLAGRSTRVVQAPVGLVGLRGPSASPWAEPALEAAASLLAGNAVLLALEAQRLRAVFLRAGVPGELLTVVPADTDLDAVCRRVVDLPRPGRLGTLLVLGGAPRERVIEAALWAGFGLHPAAAGRIVTVKGAAPGLVDALTAAASTLRVGDPRDPDTDVTETPTVVAVDTDDPRFTAPGPGPVLAVVEVPDSEAAITLVAREGRDAPVSVWGRDAAQSERVARRLPSSATWVGRHGIATTAVPTRVARHAAPRQLEWRAAWAPGTPTLPADQDLIAAQRTLTEVRHGREARRWPALRVGARALARAARRER